MTELDAVIHAPHRLRLCSMLSVVDQAEFATLRDSLDVADSVLSKHVATLADAGYVTIRKSSVQGKRSTWLALTREGRRALQRHLAALQAIIDAAARDS